MEDVDAMIENLTSEKTRLDFELDVALHAFAEYEEGMNARWRTADSDERNRLMEERNAMEEKLGIVEMVLRLDEIRAQLDSLNGRRC